MRFLFFWWCPGRDLNSYTSRQRLLRPSCLPFHHLGKYVWIFNFSSCTPLECRPALRRLVLGSMAPYGRTSTIPSPGQICLNWNFSIFLWMVLEMGLEPTHPKAYASETYVSTIPPPELIIRTYGRSTCTPLDFVSEVWLSNIR